MSVKYSVLLLVLLFLLWSGVECVLTDIVELGQGRLRGLRSISATNRYYGIPYAVSERFQPPQDPPKWQGTFHAVRRFTSCAQIISILTLGTEDCLQLDVYSPEDAKPGDKLPVVMFIHGGGYYYGSKAHYDPEFLVSKRTVAVIINYRVGVLGFLCLNEIANLGLKDQVAALKWIKNNISFFGGDPDNVTIFGQSAGASSAGMHFLSAHSKGLFHKAVLFSGSPLAPWAFNPEPWAPAYEDASLLGNPVTNEDVIKIFREASVTDLLHATRDDSINSKYFKYSPCVDSNNTSPFFHDTPFDILKSGNFNKVPMIVGFTDVEGMLFYGLHDERTFRELDVNFKEKLPSVFSWCSEKEKQGISDEFRSHYFGGSPINSSYIKGVVNYYSDWVAYSSVDAFSSLMARVSGDPVYNYMFSYVGARNFARFIFGARTGLRGASHSDDIFYVFKPAGLTLLLSKEDKLFVDRFTSLLANFMRTGNPTPKKTKLLPITWPPRTANNATVLRLDHQMALTPMPESLRGKFWLKMLCQYGLKGFVPCESQALCQIGD